MASPRQDEQDPRAIAFGRELSSLRLAAGMKLRGLALAIPCDAGHLSHIEGGHRRPSRHLVSRCEVILALNGGLLGLFDRLWSPESESPALYVLIAQAVVAALPTLLVKHPSLSADLRQIVTSALNAMPDSEVTSVGGGRRSTPP